jgi:hypothetical protein
MFLELLGALFVRDVVRSIDFSPRERRSRVVLPGCMPEDDTPHQWGAWGPYVPDDPHCRYGGHAESRRCARCDMIQLRGDITGWAR